MRKAKLAFYKARGNWVDILIRLWTRSKYSHVELIYNNEWYSSSPRDNGVRKKNIEMDSEKWDFIDIKIEPKRLNEIYNKYNGCGYDFIGIFLSNFFEFGFHSKKKVMCSEFIAEILNIKNPQTINPGELFNIIQGYNNEI